MGPEIYILRIYRRSSEPPRQIAGRVETPGGELCAGFATLAELSEILEMPKAHLQRAPEPEASAAPLIKVYRQKGSDDQNGSDGQADRNFKRPSGPRLPTTLS